MSDEKPKPADWNTANNEDWLNQKIKPGSNIDKPVQHVNHKDLKLATPLCPACDFGWLLVARNPKPPHEIMPGDNCSYCGQRFIYRDIDDLRETERMAAIIQLGTATTNLFFSESDIRKIITQHLEAKGYKQMGELEINVRSKKDIPEGAIAGDVVGINATCEERIERRIEREPQAGAPREEILVLAQDYLKRINIEDRVLNREDLPEFWKTISQLMADHAVASIPILKSLTAETQNFMGALAMSSIIVDYMTAEVISDTYKKVLELSGEFSLRDSTDIVVRANQKYLKQRALQQECSNCNYWNGSAGDKVNVGSCTWLKQTTNSDFYCKSFLSKDELKKCEDVFCIK